MLWAMLWWLGTMSGGQHHTETCFIFDLQVSVFLSSIYLGAKNGAGKALRKSIAMSIY